MSLSPALPRRSRNCARTRRTLRHAPLRAVSPALRDDGQAAGLEDAQLPDDAVASSVEARAARAEPQPWRSTRSGYASSSASAGVVSVFDIVTCMPPARLRRGMRPGRRRRLVVGEAVVAEREVVHRSLALRGTDRLPERGEDEVDDPRPEVSTLPAATAAAGAGVDAGSLPERCTVTGRTRRRGRAGRVRSGSGRRSSRPTGDRSGQLRFPGCCGAVPAKSSRSRRPRS